MTPYVDDTDFTLYVGDVREVLAGLPAESVHCCVTSPPYWGLRDYGTGSWVGGDDGCDHTRQSSVSRESSGLEGATITQGGAVAWTNVCGKCGARRVDHQLGLEPTPEEYVANMVAVFREVRRVLRRDGTCWLNIGDSYASGGGAGNQGENGQMASRSVSSQRITRPRGGLQGGTTTVDVSLGGGRGSGLKPKDLVGIPWRLAFALQADGWYLRSDIIWSKPNPMPESVTDRPTKAHEYLFLLTRSARYHYDADAIREEAEFGRREWTSVEGNMAGVGINGERGHATVRDFRKPPQDDTLDGSEGEAPRGPDGRRKTTVTGGDGSIQHRDGERWPNGGRNKRSVWEIATEAYPDAHFATFPQALVEPCVLAGTSERGCCPVCGAPWERETDVSYEKSPVHGAGSVVGRHYETGANNYDGAGMPRLNKVVETTGWKPGCECSLPFNGVPRPVPCTVLDPFMGSGTTALVARRHGRRSIGVELNPEYAKLAAARLQQLSLLAEPA